MIDEKKPSLEGMVTNAFNNLGLSDKEKKKLEDNHRWLDKAKLLEVFEDTVVPEPETVLAVDTPDGDTGIVSTLGNVSVISGDKKAGKGFFLSCCMASVLSNVETLDCIHGSLPKGKRNVLIFDTEQGLYHVKKSVERIKNMIGKYPSNLRVFSFRGETPEDAISMIEALIYNDPNLGFVGIDGVVDLMNDSNCLPEAIIINTLLLRWSKKAHVHIMTVIHNNPGSEKPRGHLGTIIQQKAECRLNVEKTEGENYFTVRMAESREREFTNPIAFTIDDDEIPRGTEYRGEIRSVHKAKKAEISSDNLQEIIKRCYTTNERYFFTALREELQKNYLDVIGYTVGINNAKKFVTKASNEGMIFQKVKNGEYYIKVV